MQYFTYNWHNTYTVQVASLITIDFLLLLNSRFTTNAQNILHLNWCTHGHILLWTVAHFQRSGGGCEWFEKQQESVGKLSLHFKLELNTPGCFKCASRLKSGRLNGLARFGAVDRKLNVCGRVLIWTFFLFGVRTLAVEVCPSILDTPCIT